MCFPFRRRRPAPIPNECGTQDDQRKRHPEKENRDERRGRDQPFGPARKRAPGNSDQRLDNDGEHCRFNAGEDGSDDRHIPEIRVKRSEHQNDKRSWHDEQQARREASTRAVKPPAGIGRQLHGLGTRQQRAEVQSQ